jgi:hypothetical protein
MTMGLEGTALGAQITIGFDVMSLVAQITVNFEVISLVPQMTIGLGGGVFSRTNDNGACR